MARNSEQQPAKSQSTEQPLAEQQFKPQSDSQQTNQQTEKERIKVATGLVLGLLLLTCLIGISVIVLVPSLKRFPWYISGVVLVILLLIELVFTGYFFKLPWVGVGDYRSPEHPEHTEFQRKKTFWNWLQLLVIPLVLAGVGYGFTAQQNQTSLQIAEDQQQQAALESYLGLIHTSTPPEVKPLHRASCCSSVFQ